MLTIERSLNVYAAGIPQIINLSQYDNDFQLVFPLYTSEGVFTVPSGTTAEIMGTKVDGNGYSADATISGSTVTVTGNVQMTACAGRNVFEIVLTNSGKRLATINFILQVERAALDADTIQSETVLKELNAIIESAATSTQAAEDAEDAADRAEEAARTLTIDPTLTQSGQAADAKVTGEEIDGLKADLRQKTGLSEEAKVALLDCFEHVAWIDEHGQTYYDALYDALYPDAELDHITAVFTQGSLVVYPSTPLGDLKPYLTVTGYYKDGTSGRVTDYALSGTLTVGTSTVTATKDGKTTTFNVTVSQPYWDYEWSATSGIAPTMMQAFAYNFTDYASENAMFADNFYVDFEYVGNCEVLFDAKIINANIISNRTPQISIRGAQGSSGYNGFKTAFQTPSTYVETNISGTFEEVTPRTNYSEYHSYRMKYENGTGYLYIDDTLVGSGVGVANNAYLYITGIFASYMTGGEIDVSESAPYTQMAIREIKFKALS